MLFSQVFKVRIQMYTFKDNLIHFNGSDSKKVLAPLSKNRHCHL